MLRFTPGIVAGLRRFYNPCYLVRQILREMDTIKLFTALLLCVAVLPAMGDDKKDEKEQVFKAGYEQVWKACLDAGSDRFALVASDKEEGLLSFEKGGGLASRGFLIGVKIEKKNETETVVRISIQIKGEGYLLAGRQKNNLRKDYFKAIEKALKKGD